MKKEHGLTGQKSNNFKGDDARSSHLHIRLKQEDKALFVKKAQKEGLKLADWVIKHLGEV